jgi:hypothetical protein
MATETLVNVVVGGNPQTEAFYYPRNKRYTVVDVADNSTTVSAAPAMFYSIHVNTALSAHALPILDGSATIANLAASSGVGTNLVTTGIPCLTSLIVDPNDAATGSVTVVWAPL